VQPHFDRLSCAFGDLADQVRLAVDFDIHDQPGFIDSDGGGTSCSTRRKDAAVRLTSRHPRRLAHNP
jgi:hypothetical protein